MAVRHGRWYDDACGTAFALELVGERWSLLIVRELLLGGRRFGALRGDLPGISAKVLTERLETLERAGVLARRQLPAPANAQVYELTPWGYAAEPAIQELGRWAARSPDHDPTLPISAVGLMISLRTLFVPARAKRLRLAAALHVAAERFVACVADGAITVSRGEVDHADFTLAAPDAGPLAAAIHGKVPAEALRDAGLRLDGDAGALARFAALFSLPDRIGAA